MRSWPRVPGEKVNQLHINCLMSLINEYGNPGTVDKSDAVVIATTRLSGNIRSNQLGEVPCCCRIRQAVQRNVKHATAVKESMAVNDVTVRFSTSFAESNISIGSGTIA